MGLASVDRSNLPALTARGRRRRRRVQRWRTYRLRPVSFYKTRASGRNHQLTKPTGSSTALRLNIAAICRVKVAVSVVIAHRAVPISATPWTVQMFGMSAEIPPRSRAIIFEIAAPFKGTPWALKSFNQSRNPASRIAREKTHGNLTRLENHPLAISHTKGPGVTARLRAADKSTRQRSLPHSSSDAYLETQAPLGPSRVQS